jgi:phosphoribosylamine--glycine ligase
MMACVKGTLEECRLRWVEGCSCTIVCAAPGYPNAYPKGLVITGLDDANTVEGVTVYHAGTKLNAQNEIVTAGGRVLNVTAIGRSLRDAVNRAYEGVKRLQFEGMHYRKDIAHRY